MVGYNVGDIVGDAVDINIGARVEDTVKGSVSDTVGWNVAGKYIVGELVGNASGIGVSSLFYVFRRRKGRSSWWR